MKTPPKGRNLAGIIPLSGRSSSLNFPWPDYLHPLRDGFLCIERSILECALAGCDSIWVVCCDDVAPLVKKRIGDYVMDPRYFEEKDFVKKKDYHEKWIPIFYTPIPQKIKDRRDSLGWSILEGSLTAFIISDKMSQWSRPSKYFVSFPYGIIQPTIARENRDLIRGKENVYFSHGGKTVRDNLYLPFSFKPEEWPHFKWNVKNNCTGGSRKIPAAERWSSKNFSLDKIFNIDIIDIDNLIEVGDYYCLDSWKEVLEFYKSDLKINRPSKQFMKPYFIQDN
tara:strand:+ start:21 stop:863 length:843 start_codon:yes stop_codon:yes gene_type:complete